MSEFAPIGLSLLMGVFVQTFLLLLYVFMEGREQRPILDFFLFFQVMFIFFSLGGIGAILRKYEIKVESAHFIQVGAQFATFIFHFYSKSERQQLLANTFLFCFVMLHLSLGQTCLLFIFISTLLFLSFLFIFPQEILHFCIFLIYVKEPILFEWSFFLSLQQLIYFMITLLFDGKGGTAGKNFFYLYISLVCSQLIFGVVGFGRYLCFDYTKVCAVISGSLIVYMTAEKREGRALRLAFLLYFILSLLLGWMLSPPDPSQSILGVPRGLFLFIFLHLLFLASLFVFKKFPPDSFVPFFLGATFFVLNQAPDATFLARWIQGIDLLIFLLAAYSCFFNEGGNKKKGG